MARPERAGDVVLVADDDAVTRRLLSAHLEGAGFSVVLARDGTEAIERLRPEVAVALFDLQMPGASGMDCLRFCQTRFPETVVMVISQFGEVRDAVEAMKQGAAEYITKPVDPEELLTRVRQAVRAGRLARENRQLRQAVGGAMPMHLPLGHSPAAAQLAGRLRKVAALDATVLLTGETGTGKTTIARLIHQEGPRAGGPFVAVSCASLPRDLVEAELFGHARGAFTGAVSDRPGKAEVAHGGTLLLDEIGDLPLELQPKLLCFLQERTFQRIGDPQPRSVDVRVIAATLHDLESSCRQGTFRQDLFFRLNVLPIAIPPLRERTGDVLEFAEYVLARIGQQRGCAPLELTEEARRALLNYPWPGNIRELENVLERASAFCEGPRVTERDLGLDDRRDVAGTGGGSGSLAGLTLRQIERRAIEDALQASGGNKKEAARQLGVDEKTIHNKIKRLGIER